MQLFAATLSPPLSSDCSLSLNGMTCLWCSFPQMTPSSGMFNMFAEFDSCRCWLDDVSSDGCFYLGLTCVCVCLCVIFCLNLSWFGLTNDHEHFLQESCDAHFFFVFQSLHHISSLSPQIPKSTGIYFCFGRTTIINFCKL